MNTEDFNLMLSTLVMGADRVGSRLAVYLEHNTVNINLTHELVKSPWLLHTDAHPLEAYYHRQDLEALEEGSK